MAIVRTTPKETSSGEPPLRNGKAAPPSQAPASEPVVRDTTRSVVRSQARPVAPRSPVGARPAPGRGAAQQQGGEPVLSVQDTITELRRVVWPSRAEVQSGTIVTIGLLIFFAIYIFGLDSFFFWFFRILGLYSQGTPGR